MINLAFNFCEFGWPLVILSWLLPFLLGLLFAYFTWYPYKSGKEKLEKEVKVLKQSNIESEAEIDRLNHKKVEMDSDIALLKGQLRESRYRISELEGIIKKSSGADEKEAPATEARHTTTDKSDDLSKIEGIGPKIQDLLNAAGIYTFKDLSGSPVEVLKGILEAAGPSFRMADPRTWAQQATLAAAGKWEDLEKLQDELKGGKA